MISRMIKAHQPCDCGSSDGMSIYSDGHSYCFVCETRRGNSNMTEVVENTPVKYTPLTTGVTMGLRDRNISTATCKKFGVTAIGTPEDVKRHIYPYTDKKGVHIANKTRVMPKEFSTEGAMGNTVALFGQDKFTAGESKAITIYEGELDAMSGYELTGSRFASVSLPNGAASAVAAIKHNLEYLESFEKVVLCFDNDEVGKLATERVIPLFSIGKVRIMKLDLKDANEYLKVDKHLEFVRAWHQSAQWIPEDVVCSSNMLERMKNKKKVESIEYPWDGMNAMTYGIRKGELVMVTAPTGIGKTQILREIEYHIHQQKPQAKIGTLFLEEQPEESSEGLISVHANKPFHKPDTVYTELEYDTAFNEVLKNGNFYFYENFGEFNIDKIINRIRYYVKGLDCEYIFLDHLSIIVSGQEHSDERRALDEIATKLKHLTIELNVAIIAVIHLNRQGQIRGTAGVEQLSNTVIHLERDIEHADEKVRNTTKLTLRKNRFGGSLGVACYLYYDKNTGRLIETTAPEEDEFNN